MAENFGEQWLIGQDYLDSGRLQWLLTKKEAVVNFWTAYIILANKDYYRCRTFLYLRNVREPKFKAALRVIKSE